MRAIHVDSETRGPRGPHRVRRLAAALAGALLLALLAPACDNPACVFGPGNCVGPGSDGDPIGEGAAQAQLPADGAWIANARPRVVAVAPNNGAQVHPDTPITIRFSESMQATSLLGSIFLRRAVIDTGGGPGGPGGPGVEVPLPTTPSLLGDGRFLVLVPQTSLGEGDYEVVVDDENFAFDLTAQRLDADPGVIGNFTVVAEDPDNPTDPAIVATYPADGNTNQSETGQFVVVFDRSMEPSSFDDIAFVVNVNGSPPDPDPSPEPLLFGVETRVWTWSSEADGERVPFGASASVEVSLSPAGDELVDEAGGLLPAEIVTWDVDSVLPPQDALLVSTPSDAIGIDNLVDEGTGNYDPVMLSATLTGAQEGDRITAYVFGTSPATSEAPPLLALTREVTIPSGGDTSTVTFGPDDLDLIVSAVPLDVRLADGDVTVALRIARGDGFTPVRLLDADPDTEGDQSLVLDTTRPELVRLFPRVSTAGSEGEPNVDFRSQVDDLVVAGEASEVIAFAEVSVPALGVDNFVDLGSGPEASVLGTGDSTSFLARPVPVGLLGDDLDTDLGYVLTLFDRARNASQVTLKEFEGEMVTGVFTQIGSFGTTALGEGSAMIVRVFDATTLEPIPDARVITHVDATGASSAIDSKLTPSTGVISVTTHGVGEPGTILTVDHPDYQLFSFQGVPTTRMDVLLEPTVLTGALPVGSTVTVTGTAAVDLIPMINGRVGDSRRFPFTEPTFATDSCATSLTIPPTSICPWPAIPDDLFPGRFGAVSYLAGNLLIPAEPSFSAAVAVQAFDIEIPRRAVATTDQVALAVDSLLTSETDPTQLPVKVTDTVLSPAFVFGFDLADLVNDPETTGEPSITLEGLVPGVVGNVPVGVGLAFYDAALEGWNVRAAHPGVVGATGELVVNGTVDADLRLRAELRFTDNRILGVRPKLSELEDLPDFPAGGGAPEAENVMFPGRTSMVQAPLEGASTVDQFFDVVIEDVLTTGGAEDYGGLYELRLEDDTGRQWSLWRADPPTAGATIEFYVPDVAGAGGAGLADGELHAQVRTFAWRGLELDDFFWSDVVREHDLYASGVSTTFSKP